MKPLRTVAETDGLVLKTRGTEFLLFTGGKLLMSSTRHGSEDELAQRGCERLATGAPRVLIGGLGFGYTLRAALDVLAPSAEVTVCEASAALVDWNRTEVAHLAENPLADGRVRVVVGDVQKTISAKAEAFDAILLDVDNGPFALSRPSNTRLYTREGMALIRRALTPRGRLVIWSATDDAAFARLLE
ncbi:MAG: hypothetical protein JNG84_07245, partial [Archangium sp.]|nr:hypothetical protein [Archangium sp.]